ncbi:SIMPL domain-containing protein [Actinoplanes sp. NPDC023714]|uniref:SIMPL domain-containing protein n=1 Tax=Actinoplanes sp. NPDC023714 TaxID=3154322 RepID=UPI0034105BDC
MDPGRAPLVIVQGEAHREVPPELAVFSVAVSATDRDRAALITRLTERAAAVSGILDAHAAAIERRETAGVQVHPGRRKHEYSGNIETSVVLHDFGDLGVLLAALAGLDLTSVAGPWWQLKPGNRAGSDVRKKAVEDALDRARDYAAAVGATIERIVEIADEEGGGMHRMMRSEAFDQAFDLTPQVQTVTARVRLKVVITDPVVS